VQTTFVDYYAQLGCEPDATEQAIESVMRSLAQELQASETEPDPTLVANIKTAYEVLQDPVSRAEYDQEYLRHQQQQAAQQPGSLETVEGLVDELKFYEKRRADTKMPGIGAGGLTEEVSYPSNVLEFHLWYFRERGWIERLEGGQLAITALGVDKIEELTRDYVAPS